MTKTVAEILGPMIQFRAIVFILNLRISSLQGTSETTDLPT